MALAPIVVHLEFGEPKIGEWCDRCQTSAGMTIEAYLLGDKGISKCLTARQCARCDPDELRFG